MEYVHTQIYIWVVLLRWLYEEEYQQGEIWLPF